MSKKNRQKRLNKTLKLLRIQASLDRAEFFAEGGTLAEWRGISSTHTDRKKKFNKKACRGKHWQK